MIEEYSVRLCHARDTTVSHALWPVLLFVWELDDHVAPPFEVPFSRTKPG